ncbi:MAG: flagellar biosynthetic protein FliR [Candidatus Eremiobacteraeota bacterium]|nr:flagellar biosynthetic protein FliR [Candidatus Eremiobacteraeota bacterium]
MIDATFALVFARCAAFVSRAPGFSHPSVPRVVRAGFALVLSIGIVPGVPRVRWDSSVHLAVAFCGELFVGAATGMAASLLYDGAYAGGRTIDDYVGIRGSVPSAQVFAASGFGRIWSMAFLGGFFLLDGYRIVVRTLADGFARVPPGAFLDRAQLEHLAVAMPVVLVQSALLVAGPAIGMVFLAQIALATLSRIVPRLATFTLSFPLAFGVALLVTVIAVPQLLRVAAIPWIPPPFGPFGE